MCDFSGDLNISDDHVFWDEVRAQAIWSDPHCVLGSDVPQFTCWPTQGQPSRIDFFVLSTHAMSSVAGVEVHTGTTLPVHAPIEIKMDLDIRSVDILSYPQPLPLTAPAGLPSDLVAFQDEFQRMLFDNRLEEAYERWSRYWESWMLSDAPPTVNKASHMGRGTTAKVVTVPPKPPRSTEAPPDVCFLRKFLGRLREFSRLRHYDSGYALSLGAKVRKQAEMYMKRFGTPPPHPSGSELRALELHVAATLQARQLFHDKTSKEKWRARLTHRLGVHRTISQAVKRTSDASIRSMRETRKSQPLLEQEQIFGLLDGYWQQIRMAPGRDLGEWEREFLGEIPQSPQSELPVLEPRMIRERLAAMKPYTSKGPDAWSVLELRALPDEAICQLTMFLAAVETWGSWPEAMREIHVVPLQKESDPTPDRIRPIGISSVIYRAWAATRFRQLIPWMHLWCPEQLTAYKPHMDVQMHNLRRACLLEQDEIAGLETVRASFDLQKAFAFVPHEAVALVARKFGLPEWLLRLIMGRMTSLRMRWKLNGSLSQCTTPRRGVIQGCALSCLIFNMVMAPLVIKTQNRRDLAPLEAQADDIFCRALTDDLLRASVDTLLRFLHPLGIPLQKAKTQCLRTGPSSSQILEVSDAVLVPAHEVKVLGQGLVNYVPSQGTGVFVQRVSKYLQRVHTIASLNLPYVQKIRVLMSMASSVLAFSPWQVQPSKAPTSCRSALIRALFPKIPRHRASEIVTQVLSPGHLLDPPTMLAYRLIVLVGQMLAELPGDVLRIPSVPSALGPLSLLHGELASRGMTIKQGNRVVTARGKLVSLQRPTGEKGDSEVEAQVEGRAKMV